MSSRRTIAAINRPHIYDRTVAPHVWRETVEIDSTEPVLERNGCYWVASTKFACRYYRVVLDENGQWFCSSRDERVAAACKAQVELFLIKKNDAA